MSPQMACPRWCIVTLVAFIWPFSTVCFQMIPQIACVWWCKLTLVALVWTLILACLCHSQWSFYINITVTQLMILIHHYLRSKWRVWEMNGPLTSVLRMSSGYWFFLIEANCCSWIERKRKWNLLGHFVVIQVGDSPLLELNIQALLFSSRVEGSGWSERRRTKKQWTHSSLKLLIIKKNWSVIIYWTYLWYQNHKKF